MFTLRYRKSRDNLSSSDVKLSSRIKTLLRQNSEFVLGHSDSIVLYVMNCAYLQTVSVFCYL